MIVTFRRFENIGFDEISRFRTVEDAGPYKLKVKFYFTKLGFRPPLLIRGAQARAASIACGEPHGYANGDRKTSQRRGRGVLIEPRRALTIWWRMPLPLSQSPPPRGKRREPEGIPSLGVLSLVTFFAQAKKVIKKIRYPRALCADGYLRKNLLKIIIRKVLSSSTCLQVAALAPHHFPAGEGIVGYAATSPKGEAGSL